MAEIVLDPKDERLQLECGQCGSTCHLSFEIDEGKLRILVLEPKAIEDDPQNYLSAFHIVV